MFIEHLWAIASILRTSKTSIKHLRTCRIGWLSQTRPIPRSPDGDDKVVQVIKVMQVIIKWYKEPKQYEKIFTAISPRPQDYFQIKAALLWSRAKHLPNKKGLTNYWSQSTKILKIDVWIFEGSRMISNV